MDMNDSATSLGRTVTTRSKYFARVAEGVRATIGAYTQALDDGRTDDVVATFCPDGVCEIPGMGTHTGHDALREAYSKWKPEQPQRHLVLNTVVTEVNEHEATAISDVIFILRGDSGWSIQLVGRYHDVLHEEHGIWRFHNRTATFLPGKSERKRTP
jgi:hypothetical protein